MAEQQAKLSKLCLTGFILDVLSPFALALSTCFFWRLDNAVYFTILVVLACMPFIGMILSIIGLVTARKKGRKGKGLGIAGIVLPAVYAVVVVIIFASMVFMIKGAEKAGKERAQSSDVYCLDGITGLPENTQYNVSRYRVPYDYDFDSPDAFASEAELSSYAESKLDEITDINSIRAKGTYQEYVFIIIRIDRFNQWVADDHLATFDHTNDGYGVISYKQTSITSSAASHRLNMYKDPLDRFIILTNCNDNKVITDFF